MDVELPNDFTPRDYQARFMRAMDNGTRRAFWVMHRRAGKDLTALHQTAKMAHQRIGVYWHVFPSFAQARKAIWEGFTKDGKRIMENVFPGFLNPKRAGSIVKRKDEQQMMIELTCGSVWRLIGSDRIEVVGAGPVGVVFSEFAIANPRSWEMIRPMLRENGGWAVFITTPRGDNHAKRQFDLAVKDLSWFCETQTVYDTKLKFPSDKAPGTFVDADGMMAEEKAAGMQDALINQEYLCDWNAALVGSVWGDLLDQIKKLGGVEDFPHDYDNVFTTWDLGFTDSTAIWFWQVQDGAIDVIDYYEAHGKPLSHYYDEIESKPYRYIKHWLPHDARQVTLSSGVSILNQMLKRWPGQVACGPDLPLLDGIQAVRWLLQQGTRFHSRVEADGVAALRNYHYEYDEEKRLFSPRPFHDWSSHCADAMRYLAGVVKTSDLLKRGREPVKEPVRPLARPLHMRVSLNDLFEEHSTRIRNRRRV